MEWEGWAGSLIEMMGDDGAAGLRGGYCICILG
jgi:hypothetical protein